MSRRQSRSGDKELTTGKKRAFFPLIIAAIVLGGVVTIVGSSQGVYDLEVKEVLANKEKYVNREIKVAGTIAPGSVTGSTEDGSLHFDIQDEESNVLKVHFTKRLLPDPFAEGRQVIAQGRLREDGVLDSPNLTVKCPSRYQEEGMTEEKAKEYYQQKYEDGHPRS